MVIIDAYDLISLVSSMNISPLLLSAKKINLISRKLSEKGKESRFVMRSFETIAMEYPSCITVSRTEIFIAKPSELLQISNRKLEDSIVMLIKDIVKNG